ncbi:LOW QUALITY PROTEIN: taste receptor type 1 member 3-like [Oreochromis aureus]|uniref:LOW QUALITY PROTEIN: taste receptor type 1 member 3-like n=1 Tax=Oreochromis aureus TaxID=47969 RepID=UPI0019535AE9|nr:LOW QUALITY PROTEIN: taste receptor type 1 member 3-like [Oreochromis aureus]
MASCFTLMALCCFFRLSCSESLPEWVSNISTNLFSLSGDIMLGGLFPINDVTSNLSDITEPNQIRCESVNKRVLGLAIAMKYAVDGINGNQTLLPGIKLGYEIYDTCRQSSIIINPTLSFLTEKSSQELPVQCNYTDYETSIVAVIGPFESEMVSVIGKLLGFFMLPQISYGATSDKFSDKLLYPSFFRTVPSDKWQVDVMIKLIQAFGWNWVALVGSDEVYGQQGVQLFTKMTVNTSVCVAYQGLIPVYTDPKPAIKTIIHNIQTTNVRVVVVFSVAEQAEYFFREVIMSNLTAVWIGCTSWAIHTRVTSLPSIETVGTIIAFVDKTDTLGLFTYYAMELFKKLSEERTKTSTPTTNPDSRNNPNNPCPQCWNLSPDNISIVEAPAVQTSAFSVYAAVYSVAQALHNLLECNSTACKWGSGSKIYPWKLLQVLKNTSLNINGTHLDFDNDGNPNIGYKVIQWIWANSSQVDFRNVGEYTEQKLFLNKSLFQWHTKQIPVSTCSTKCDKGQVLRVKGFYSCCFDCIDCLAGTYQANEDDTQCTKCPDRQWSQHRSTNCTDPIFKFFTWDSQDAVIMMLVGVLLLVCQGSVGVMFLMHRGTPLVKASGGPLSFVAVLGLMGASLSLLLFLGEPGDVVCRLQLPFTSIFQTVTLSVILSISLQIICVTEFPEMAASHLHMLRGPVSWLFVLICCAVQAGFCGWFVQEGPSLSEYVANMTIDFVEFFLSCPVSPLIGFALMQVFNGAMALASFMCTFMAVEPLYQYNLARDITFSTLIYCVIWVIFIPIYVGNNRDNDKIRSIVHVYFSLASNFGLLAAYYFPKCYFLLRKPELNTPKYFCTFLEGVPITQTEEEQQPKAEEGQ